MTPNILKTYLRRLTNLSTRNRSLLLTHLPAEQFLDWQSLDFVDNRSAFNLLKDILSQKKTIKLCPAMDSRSEKVNEISKRLRKIARTERFIEEERGSEDLYVAYPFIRGKLMDGTIIHAPLAFFPVTLSGGDSTNPAQWQLHRRNELALLNRSFLLAYSHFNQVKIADEVLEKSLDELSSDALVFRTELYEFLKNSSLAINFNQELFQDYLCYFDAQSKADLELLEKNGELKLYPEAVLGIFPQAGSYLGPDYEALIAKEKIEEAFWNEQPISKFFPKEENTFTAFPQDASQEQALLRVKQGESLVVQGPPGTGKSQLIANLMTDFAARGKRVLLICQKRVALDVVYERLQQVDVTPFVALVHDFKNDRATLYGQLDTQIEQVEAYQKQNYGLDAIMLERQFLQTSRAIEQLTGELETFKTALFDASVCGLSPKELYMTSNPSAHSVDFPQFRAFCFDEKLETFLKKLNRFEQYTAHLPSTHPWCNRVNFSTIGFQERNAIKTTIDDVLYAQQTITEKTEQLLSQSLDLYDVLTINSQSANMKQWLESLAQASVWHFFKQQKTDFFAKKLKPLLKEIEQLQQTKMLGNEVISSELALFSVRLDQLIAARQSVLKWLFYGDKDYFKKIIEKQGLSLTINDLYQLKQRLQNRQKWEDALRILEGKWELPIVAEQQNETINHFQNHVKANKTAQKAMTTLEQNFNFLTNLIAENKDFASFQKAIEAFLIFCHETAQHFQSWQRYLTQNQIKELLQNPTFSFQLKETLSQDFDVLVEADKLKESFSTVETEVIQALQMVPLEIGEWLETKFQNSLRLAWLAYLEEKQPILRGVSSLKISQLEEELQAAIVQKQALSRAILLMQLREQTYKEVEFNRLQNRTTYRELQHQVAKKRKIWPVRKLMEQHADEVFRLVPCWLASPETVSAVFPLVRGLFDLVIFDEASQCYAEYGIPAMYRGQQTVVVGDSKQLTPYDLYRVRYESENDEETPALEVESLLDLAKQYLPETLLEGHYRSRSLDLIGFSNQHFYKNKLQLLPHFDDANATEPVINYVKVEGVWENNRNEIEAQKVIELLEILQNTHPTSSLGVVTFNQPQQQLIENRLNRDVASLAALFIKNIENVQGDERDIIVFSVGYAPDTRGKMRAQFGSLNAQGGENRLNVAITRARQKIYIVTSILPNQLQVEEATHAGPKLLKAYLQYALEVSENRDRKELPFADLTVQNTDGYESVILTDDNRYQQAISIKEPHAYLPLQLRTKGWRFERVWSRVWWSKQ